MNNKSNITEKQKNMAIFAKALSHPVRIYILNLLAETDCCFSGDLAEDLPIARSTLSQHLKELKKSGLIKGCIEYPKIRYCLNREEWEHAKKLLCELLNK